MIDLGKEFRTLKLMAKVLLILGIALLIGGVGAWILTAPPKAPPGGPGTQIVPRVEDDHNAKATEKISKAASELGRNTAILGAVFIVLGFALGRMLRNTLDDDFTDTDQQLFKEYAEQMALAEKRKRQRPKRPPPA